VGVATYVIPSRRPGRWFTISLTRTPGGRPSGMTRISDTRAAVKHVTLVNQSYGILIMSAAMHDLVRDADRMCDESGHRNADGGKEPRSSRQGMGIAPHRSACRSPNIRDRLAKHSHIYVRRYRRSSMTAPSTFIPRSRMHYVILFARRIVILLRRRYARGMPGYLHSPAEPEACRQASISNMPGN